MKIPLMEGYLAPADAARPIAAARTYKTVVARAERLSVARVRHRLGGGAHSAARRRWLPLPQVASRPGPASRCRRRSAPRWRWAQHKFYVDELYDLLIIRPFTALSNVLYKVVDAVPDRRRGGGRDGRGAAEARGRGSATPRPATRRTTPR